MLFDSGWKTQPVSREELNVSLITDFHHELSSVKWTTRCLFSSLQLVDISDYSLAFIRSHFQLSHFLLVWMCFI